jgi:class 3 adenylate cyclase
MDTLHSTICKGCWQHMRMPVPIRGPLSLPLRLFGIKISRMNPDLCTICETMFTRVKRRKQITVPATVLFADLRGYTTLSQAAAAGEVEDMLDGFSDECARAVWQRDGIVNKFIGDAMLAIFNFPILRPDHVQQAVEAAHDIQHRWAERTRALGVGRVAVGLGVGVHTGTASIGEIGTAYKDFTIIGPVVNMASRIQSAATAGEVLVSTAVHDCLPAKLRGSTTRECRLKGFDAPITVHPLPV